MGTLSILNSTNGRARRKPIHCRTPTRSSCDAVAWDGSREAVRAVHDAWPLFCQSQTIQIVVMIPPSAADNEVDAERLLAHLAKHGVGIEADVVRIKTEEEHDSLRKQLEQGRYDLLVMGLLAPPVVRIYLRRTLPVRSLVGENPGACFPLAQDQARAEIGRVRDAFGEP